MKGVLIALVLLFGLVGLFLWTFSSYDPAPRDEWVATTGIVSEAKITQTKKAGRVWTLMFENDPDRFALNFVEKIPELEPVLTAQIRKGTELTIQTVPRKQALAQSASKISIPVLVLQLGDRVLYDRDEQTGRTSQAMMWFGRGAAMMAWLVSLSLLVLLFRNRRA